MKRWLLLPVLLFAIMACDDEPPAVVHAWTGLTVVVTGANRGIGLEFARQLTAAGATVIGTARRPDEADELHATGARVEQLDVADAASVTAFADRLGEIPIDVLINNAGIFPYRGSFEDADPEVALRTYDVNTLGPLRVTQALLPNLRAGNRKLVMNMSSWKAGIAANTEGGSTGYRESKVALNMMTRTMAIELADEGFVCVAMSPGWVRTDIGGPDAELSPAESVASMLDTLSRVGPEDSGYYISRKGGRFEW